jgi:hypothetical protein
MKLKLGLFRCPAGSQVPNRPLLEAKALKTWKGNFEEFWKVSKYYISRIHGLNLWTVPDEVTS